MANPQQLLVDAAERCFEQRGVAGTTMSHIAGEAGVSRTTLYKYFAVMEDVLRAVFIREFDRFEQRLGARLAPAEDAAERLVEIVVATAENVPDNAGLARLVEGPRSRTENMALAAGRKALNQRVKSMISGPLDELAAEGRLRDDMEREALIEWIRRLVDSLVVLPQPARRSAAARRRFVADFLIPSVCAPGNRIRRASTTSRINPRKEVV